MEKTDLQRKVDDIFKLENLEAILAVLNSVRPGYLNLCKDNEFATIVNAARLDGVQELIQSVVEYVNKKETTGIQNRE